MSLSLSMGYNPAAEDWATLAKHRSTRQEYSTGCDTYGMRCRAFVREGRFGSVLIWVRYHGRRERVLRRRQGRMGLMFFCANSAGGKVENKKRDSNLFVRVPFTIGYNERSY